MAPSACPVDGPCWRTAGCAPPPPPPSAASRALPPLGGWSARAHTQPPRRRRRRTHPQYHSGVAQDRQSGSRPQQPPTSPQRPQHHASEHRALPRVRQGFPNPRVARMPHLEVLAQLALLLRHVKLQRPLKRLADGALKRGAHRLPLGARLLAHLRAHGAWPRACVRVDAQQKLLPPRRDLKLLRQLARCGVEAAQHGRTPLSDGPPPSPGPFACAPPRPFASAAGAPAACAPRWRSPRRCRARPPPPAHPPSHTASRFGRAHRHPPTHCERKQTRADHSPAVSRPWCPSERSEGSRPRPRLGSSN